MDYTSMIELKDGSSIIADAKERLWLPDSESTIANPQIIKCGDLFFDVIGYSEERRSYLLAPIKIDGAADELEKELAQQ